MNKFKEFITKNGYIIRTVVTTEVIFIFIFTVFLANCVVPTESMEPTIKASARVLASRIAYDRDEPERQDVVIFNYPDNEKIVFCKRIVGMPGEILEIKDGVTYIDGEQLDEQYIKYAFTGSYGPFYIPCKGEIVQYNKNENTAICNGYTVGDSEFINNYCELKNNKYTVKEDCYFCMGDNRDNSEDARFWTNKYVTKSKIIGKMWLNLSNGFKTVE